MGSAGVRSSNFVARLSMAIRCRNPLLRFRCFQGKKEPGDGSPALISNSIGSYCADGGVVGPVVPLGDAVGGQGVPGVGFMPGLVFVV